MKYEHWVANASLNLWRYMRNAQFAIQAPRTKEQEQVEEEDEEKNGKEKLLMYIRDIIQANVCRVECANTRIWTKKNTKQTNGIHFDAIDNVIAVVVTVVVVVVNVLGFAFLARHNATIGQFNGTYVAPNTQSHTSTPPSRMSTFTWWPKYEFSENSLRCHCWRRRR